MHRRATVQGGTIHCQSSQADVDIQAAIEMSLAANVCEAEDYHTVDDPAFQKALRASIMERIGQHTRWGSRYYTPKKTMSPEESENKFSCW